MYFGQGCRVRVICVEGRALVYFVLQQELPKLDSNNTDTLSSLFGLPNFKTRMQAPVPQNRFGSLKHLTTMWKDESLINGG